MAYLGKGMCKNYKKECSIQGTMVREDIKWLRLKRDVLMWWIKQWIELWGQWSREKSDHVDSC